LAASGTILLFIATTNTLDGLVGGNYNYDVFAYDFRQAKRLTKLHSFIVQPAISPDGTRYSFIVDDTHRNSSVHFLPPRRILRLHVGLIEGEAEEITLPSVTSVLNR